MTDIEVSDMLLIALPDHDIVMVQDLVYSDVHLSIAERHLRNWRDQIDVLRNRLFLPHPARAR